MNRVTTNSTEKLLREIVAAYRATQTNPMGTNEHIKHMRYQIARLTRVCIEMNKRIAELEEALATQSKNTSGKYASNENDDQEEFDLGKITALGDII